jgi:hypothetical protein
VPRLQCDGAVLRKHHRPTRRTGGWAALLPPGPRCHHAQPGLHLLPRPEDDGASESVEGGVPPRERENYQERNKLTVGELYDSINDHLVAKTPDLLRVAEIGKYLLIEAICSADEQDDTEFFIQAYESAGPVIDAVLEECGLDWRDSSTGWRMQSADDER